MQLLQLAQPPSNHNDHEDNQAKLLLQNQFCQMNDSIFFFMFLKTCSMWVEGLQCS